MRDRHVHTLQGCIPASAPEHSCAMPCHTVCTPNQPPVRRAPDTLEQALAVARP